MGKKKGKKGKKGNKAAPVPTKDVATGPTPAEIKQMQTLPPALSTQFKNMMNLYDRKQHKKALKTAEKILAKVPMHGETLCMKGLILHFTGGKQDAEGFVKQGLRYNLRSHVCWHVYGLLYRSQHKYDDAIKCYRQALKIDKENLTILKDISLLQVQRRQYHDFQETRRRLLMLKSTQRNNWVTYAIGNHLAGNHSKAVKILDSYAKTKTDWQKDYEDSEFLCYKNLILEESGDYQAALDHLDEKGSYIVDLLHVKTKKIEFLVKLGRADEALPLLNELIALNPENTQYYQILEELNGFKPESIPGQNENNNSSNSNNNNNNNNDNNDNDEKKRQSDTINEQHRYTKKQRFKAGADGSSRTYSSADEAKMIEMYDKLAEEYPKCSAITRRILSFSSGEEFKIRISAFITNGLRRGIPSLFRDLRPLYFDQVKRATIERLIEQYTAQLRDHCRLSPEAEEKSESPSTLMWALYYLGQHYDFVGEYVQALQVTDEAIAHTCTNLDLLVLKARIYKHAGNPVLAYAWMDKARRMDTADRYLNVKCVRYAFRADKVAEGQNTVKLFLREEDNLPSLCDLQVNWYELGVAASFLRQEEYAKALRQYHNVLAHFNDIIEDQFDFHTYCVRKMTLRPYLGVLRLIDNLHSHRFFVKAANGAIQTYITLFDQKREAEEKKAAELASMTDAERNKLLRKAKREAKARVEAEEKEEKKKSNKKQKQAQRNSNEDKNIMYSDPDGAKLVTDATDFLQEATNFVVPLLENRYEDVETQISALRLYLRKEKYLLALRAALSGLSSDPGHPELVVAIANFLKTLSSEVLAALNPLVTQVLNAERPKLETAVAEFKSQYCATSLGPRVAHVKASLLLGQPESKSLQQESDIISNKLSDDLVSYITNLGECRNVTHTECIQVLNLLAQYAHPSADSFKELSSQMFPLCTAFMSAEEVESAEKQSQEILTNP